MNVRITGYRIRTVALPFLAGILAPIKILKILRKIRFVTFNLFQSHSHE